jgi:hypothetical protein
MEGTMDDPLSAILKVAVLLSTMAAEVVHSFKERKEEDSLRKALAELRIDALGRTRRYEHELHELSKLASKLDVGEKETLGDVRKRINPLQWLVFKSLEKRFWESVNGIKDLYTDMEAVFACQNELAALSAARERSYEACRELDSITAHTPLYEVIRIIQPKVSQILARLSA